MYARRPLGFPLISRKMTASCGPRTTPPGHFESPFSSWSFVGILLLALVLPLPTSTDACGDLPRYQSMKLKGNPAPSYSPGDKVEYECRPGYRRIVPLLPTSAVCEPDNTWTPLQEACTRKLCPQLEDPLNGRVNATLQFGSEAHFSCNEGYYLVGPQILYCDLSENNVAWNAESPLCQKIICQPPKQIPNGAYTNSHKETFEYNEVVTYSCNPSNGPDEYSLVGESRLVCSGHDQWSSDPPECKVVKCEYPYIEHGKLESGFQKKYYYKAEVTFGCLEGFYLEGSPTIVCGANSTWEPKMPQCIKVLTPSPNTKPPILSHSVSTLPSTKLPNSSVSGVEPSHPTTPPATSRPGHTTPTVTTPSKELGVGIIVAIVVSIVVVIALVVGSLLYRHQKKKGLQEY